MTHPRPTRAQLDAYTVQLVDIIEKVGWAVQGVFGDQDETGLAVSFCYTVGLTEASLPELFIDRLSPSQGQPILNALATKMRAGETFAPGDTVDIEYSVPFRLRGPVDTAEAEANTARRLYGEIDLWQVLWPDREGRFPDEEGYDHVAFPQRLITNKKES